MYNQEPNIQKNKHVRVKMYTSMKNMKFTPVKEIFYNVRDHAYKKTKVPIKIFSITRPLQLKTKLYDKMLLEIIVLAL